MIRKNIKKGFTLVELVVVIAIIAILSGVGVAVYVGVTNKAKVTADSEIITQLNLQLKTKQVSKEGKNKNCYEAYLDAREIGFDLKLMKPQSGGDYIWDQEKDLFSVVKNGELITGDKDYKLPVDEEYKLWKFTSTISSEELYSQFLTVESPIESITVCSGLDVGDNTQVGNIVYENTVKPKNIILRTNSPALSSSLTVKGFVSETACDVITHYGETGSTKIWENGWKSYHERGASTIKEVNEGHYVIEENQIVAFAVLDAQNGPIVCDIEPYASVGYLEIKNNDTNNVTINIKSHALVKQIMGANATKLVINVASDATVKYSDVHNSDTTEDQSIVITGIDDEEVPYVEPQIDTSDCRHDWEHRDEYSVRFCKLCGTIETEHTETSYNKETEEDQDIIITETTTVELSLDEETGSVSSNTVTEQKNTTCEHHVYLNSSTNRLYHYCPNCGVEFGTEEHPYILSNHLELEGFFKLNDWEGYPGYYKTCRYDAEGNLDFLYAELGGDIDCSKIQWPEGYSIAYYLIFDGKGHKLSNINISGSLFNYVYYWMDFENITFENCRMAQMVKYPYYGFYHDNGGYDDFYCYNLKFNNCEFTGDGLFAYAYDCVVNLENCILNNCKSTSGGSLIAYGGYSAYGLSTGFNFYNVDIENSTAYGGAYIYYGGSGNYPLNFVNCDVYNTEVNGGQYMALGGFVGNASTSVVTFDTCSFDGSITSTSACVAGFIGQPSSGAGYLTIKNSYVSARTNIINKGGTSVCPFAGQGHNCNNNNNLFLGTLSSTAANCPTSLNGFTDVNYVKYSTLATKDDFAIDTTTGEITYSGETSFDKIIVNQRVTINNLGKNLGGYSWVFETLESKEVKTGSSLGSIKIVNEFKQVVSEDYQGDLPFKTTNTSYLTNPVYEDCLYYNDGILAINSCVYESGTQYVFANLDKDSVAITVEFLLVIEEKIEGSVRLQYSVDLTK